MRAKEIQLLYVILGLVISTFLLLNPPELWAVALSFLTLSGTLIAFSTWVRNRTLRSRSILSNGVAGGCALAGIPADAGRAGPEMAAGHRTCVDNGPLCRHHVDFAC